MDYSRSQPNGIDWKAGFVLILIILAPLAFLFGSVMIYNYDLEETRRREFAGKWDPLISLISARASIVMDENFSIDDKFASDLYLLPSLMSEIEAIILLDEQNRRVFSVGEVFVDISHLVAFGSRALTGERKLIPAEATDLGFAVSYAPVIRERVVVAAIVMGINEGEPIFGLSSVMLGLTIKAAIPFVIWVTLVLYSAHRKSIKELMEENYRHVELRLLAMGYTHEKLSDLAEAMAQELCGVLRLNDCVVYLRDGESSEIVPFGRYPAADRPGKINITDFEPGDLRLQAMAERKPRIYSLSKTGLPRAAGNENKTGNKRRIAAPLTVGNDIVGLLDIEEKSATKIDDKRLELYSRFANRAARALKGRLANVDTEKQLAEISGIVEAVEIVDSSTDLTTALGKITRRVTELKNIRFCRIFTMDEGGVNLVLRAETWAGEGIGDDSVGETHNLDEMPLHKIAMLSGQSQELSAGDLDKHIGANKDIYRPDMDDCLILIIPLLLDNRQLGCLSVGVIGFDEFPRELKFRLERLTRFLAASISRAQTCVRLKRSYDKLSSAQRQTVRAERLEAVTNLARGVSDNLTSVLKSLRDNLSDLKDESAESAIVRLVNDINSRIENLDRLEQRFSLFTEIEKRDDFQQFELAQLVTDSLGELESTIAGFRAENGEIDVAVKIVGSGQIHGSAANLKIMIKELIINSLESLNDPGEIIIETRIELNHAVLEISDNGAGINDMIGGKMFEPFFTTKKGSGRGLGMSMVYGIVSAHNGLIDLSSNKSGGNTIVIKLPLVDPEQTALYSQRKGTRGIPLSST